MADWLFWVSLGAMLSAGGIAGVGLALGSFAFAALAVGLCAVAFDMPLERQLHLFLVISGLLLIIRRVHRRPAKSDPGYRS